MRGYGEVLVGLLFAALGVAGIWYFRVDVLTILKGVIGIIVLLIGAVFLMIGVSDVREKDEDELEMESTMEEGE
jgi:1,4-dihydroxy-2-naphthoate octaprenyltransferase